MRKDVRTKRIPLKHIHISHAIQEGVEAGVVAPTVRVRIWRLCGILGIVSVNDLKKFSRDDLRHKYSAGEKTFQGIVALAEHYKIRIPLQKK
jgi:hypothetical protein